MPQEAASNPDAPGRLMSSKAALSVLNGVLGAVLSTTALVFIAKNMGPSVLGILGFGIATIGMLSFLSDFGVGSVHVRHMKSSVDQARCIGAYAAIRITLLIIFACVTVAGIELWKAGYLGSEMPTDPMLRHAMIDTMYVFLVYYILLGISQISTHTFDALDAVAKVHVPAILELVVRVSFIVYISMSVWGTTSNGPALLASAYSAGIITSILLTALLMRRYPVKMPDRAILMKYISSLAPVFIVSSIIMIDLYLDKVLVGVFWGERELGLYFAVQRMAVFVGVFSLSVATLILPSVTTYFKRDDVTASWDIVNQAERYVSLIVIPTAAFYLTFGPDILRVFLTDDFVAAVNTMSVLVVSSTVLALVLPLRSVIIGVGRSGTLFKIGLAGIAIQLVLLLVLVPADLWGVQMLGLKRLGAALALLGTSVFYFFTLRYMAWRVGKILPYSRSFRHLLAALVMVGVMYVVKWALMPTVDWIALVSLAVVGFVAYTLAVYFLEELNRADYRYFRTMLNPQDTFQYVVNELLGKRSQ